MESLKVRLDNHEFLFFGNELLPSGAEFLIPENAWAAPNLYLHEFNEHLRLALAEPSVTSVIAATSSRISLKFIPGCAENDRLQETSSTTTVRLQASSCHE